MALTVRVAVAAGAHIEGHHSVLQALQPAAVVVVLVAAWCL